MPKLRADIHELNEKGKAGDWAFAKDAGKEYLLLLVPYTVAREKDPAGEIVQLELCSGDGAGQESCYVWDGNRKAPTIEGSIRVGRFWHGTFRAGKLGSVVSD